MKSLIVYGHPYKKSFNHAILIKVEKYLKEQNQSFKIIDLYEDKFNPTYSCIELSLFKDGKTKDKNVKEYQELIKNTDSIIFIFPIWWNDVPAIIKGFIDKVMKKKFAYNVGATGVIGNITNIKRCVVFTTSTSPTWYLKFICGNAIKKVFVGSTLVQLGVKNTKWINFGNIDKSTLKQRKEYLDNISFILKRKLNE